MSEKIARELNVLIAKMTPDEKEAKMELKKLLKLKKKSLALMEKARESWRDHRSPSIEIYHLLKNTKHRDTANLIAQFSEMNSSSPYLMRNAITSLYKEIDEIEGMIAMIK